MKIALLEGAVFLFSYPPGSELDSTSHVYYKLTQIYAALFLHSVGINTDGLTHDEKLTSALEGLAAARNVTPDGVATYDQFLYDYRRYLREDNLQATVLMLWKRTRDVEFIAHLSLEEQQKFVKIIEGFQEMNKGA